MSPLIQTADLRRLLAAGQDIVLLDCRFDLAAPDAGDRAYLEAHIPGARRANLDHHLSGPAGPLGAGRHPLPGAEGWTGCLREWGVRSGTRVVAYDDAGGCFAARAWWLLRFFGHPDALVLDGGWPAWLAVGGEVESGIGARAAASGATLDGPAVQPDCTQIVTLQELGALDLVDARDPERYAGVHEPIDPRGGHIPGARNRFWKLNLDADGFFLPPELLRAQWLALLDGSSPGRVVSYCGSGVTACHNLLALAHAGIDGARLYPGSWSEYCSDASRPAATGSAP